jgi:hypothetical protein
LSGGDLLFGPPPISFFIASLKSKDQGVKDQGVKDQKKSFVGFFILVFVGFGLLFL